MKLIKCGVEYGPQKVIHTIKYWSTCHISITGEQRHVRIMLLAGSDLISTMSEPGVWSEADVSLILAKMLYVTLTSVSKLEHILGRYGTFIIERSGTDVAQATDALSAWRSNIYIIRQLIQNDVSSTKVRENFPIV